MPKKFKGVNTKAEETRARREAVKVAEREKKQKEEEDKLWEDNDKHVLRKQQRKVCVVRRLLQHFELKREDLIPIWLIHIVEEVLDVSFERGVGV